jgi:hypothetical protein
MSAEQLPARQKICEKQVFGGQTDKTSHIGKSQRNSRLTNRFAASSRRSAEMAEYRHVSERRNQAKAAPNLLPSLSDVQQKRTRVKKGGG